MSIRPALFSDIPRLVEIGHEMHMRSRYKDVDRFVEQRFKAQVMSAIKFHGTATCLFVSQKREEVTGFILGVTDRIYGIGDKFWAMDQFFYCTSIAHARDAGDLLEAFTLWAANLPLCIEIRPSTNSVIVGSDYKRIGRLMRHKGYVVDGEIFRMEISK